MPKYGRLHWGKRRLVLMYLRQEGCLPDSCSASRRFCITGVFHCPRQSLWTSNNVRTTDSTTSVKDTADSDSAGHYGHCSRSLSRFYSFHIHLLNPQYFLK